MKIEKWILKSFGFARGLKLFQTLTLAVIALPTLVNGSFYYDGIYYDDCECKEEPLIEWYAQFDLLVFKPYLDNLNYGTGYTVTDLIITNNSTLIPGLDNSYVYSGTVFGKDKKVQYQYTPGTRVKAGAYFPRKDLEAAIVWTNYHSSAKDGTQEGMTNLSNGSYVRGIPSVISYGSPIGIDEPIPFTPVTSAYGYYSLDLDEGDLLFSKKFFLEGNLIITPQIGFSFIKIKQKFNSNSLESDLIPSPPENLFASTAQFYQIESLRFEGIGGKAGFMSEWKLFPGLNFVGSFYGSLYWGNIDIKQEATNTIFGSGSTTTFTGPALLANINLLDHNNYQDVKFGSSISLGLEYVFDFNCGRNCALVRASWEGQWYPNQNLFHVYHATGAVNTIAGNDELNSVNNAFKSNMIGGDLTLSGWVLSLLISF